MNKTFNSQVFGETRHATDDERMLIAEAVTETPVAVFQELNKKLNERGLCITITSKNEIQ